MCRARDVCFHPDGWREAHSMALRCGAPSCGTRVFAQGELPGLGCAEPRRGRAPHAPAIAHAPHAPSCSLPTDPRWHGACAHAYAACRSSAQTRPSSLDVPSATSAHRYRDTRVLVQLPRTSNRCSSSPTQSCCSCSNCCSCSAAQSGWQTSLNCEVHRASSSTRLKRLSRTRAP